jgi:hypothetical protein
MRYFLLSVFLFLLFNYNTSAQICGTITTEMPKIDQQAFRLFQEKRKHQRNNQKVSIGITIHIVETVKGFANIEIQKLYDELDAVNRFFTSTGIQFFYCGAPRFIQGKGIYTYNQAATELNRSNYVPNTINIYYMDEIGDQQLSQFACGISQFPWRGELKDRFIIMQKDCSTNGAVLAHELGHFFGLFHTHETFRGRELVNGSNCETAGDLICDTPADPNLGATGVSNCLYTSNFVDANGDAYNPDPSNIMSYSPSRCQSRFSKGQSDLMNFYLETTDLSTIVKDCDFYPDYAINSTEGKLNITSGQILELSYDFDNQGITEDQEVDIHWRLAQEGEIELTIKKDVLALKAGSGKITKTFNVEFPISKGTGAYTLTAVLDPESKILERDKRNNFYAQSINVDNSQFADIVLFPNPVNNRLKVFARNKANGGDVTLEIVDHLGRVYYQEKKFKNDTEFFAELTVDFLPAGLYILNLRYDRDGISQPFLFLKE